MPDQNDESPNISSDDLMEGLDSAIEDFTTFHKSLMEETQEVGFALEVLHRTKENFIPIITNLGSYPELESVVTSGYYQIQAIRNEIGYIRNSLVNPFQEIRGLTHSVTLSCTTSGSVAGTIVPGQGNIPETPSFLKPNEHLVYGALSKLDPALADSYREIDQILYATKADNLRTSMMQARQVFDHFFEKLAPSDNVRNSKYWKPKIGEEDELLVTRRERVRYAIETHVNDLFRANTLIKGLDNIIDSYKVLNSLHTRGYINLRAARQAIASVKHYLEEFAEAIDHE